MIYYITILEKNTIKHRLAEESLIVMTKDKAAELNVQFPADAYTLFTDNGITDLMVFYLDLCKEYSREIRQEKRKRLGIPEKRKR